MFDDGGDGDGVVAMESVPLLLMLLLLLFIPVAFSSYTCDTLFLCNVFQKDRGGILIRQGV